MGKSIRAKRNIRFRNIRRDTIYSGVEQERLQRLSEKLTGKKASETMEVDEKKSEEQKQPEAKDILDIPPPKNKKKKLSTFQKRKLAKRAKLLSL